MWIKSILCAGILTSGITTMNAIHVKAAVTDNSTRVSDQLTDEVLLSGDAYVYLTQPSIDEHGNTTDWRLVIPMEKFQLKGSRAQIGLPPSVRNYILQSNFNGVLTFKVYGKRIKGLMSVKVKFYDEKEHMIGTSDLLLDSY
ncbi:hypothetical protein [Bacillus toyonensis]|uniref:hypothetical protein n=1 Tax=Bacillus toyonensis TaxID=155322 RepID=UPI000BFDDECC|nr:hypothetical protein [Bacillus toyonensis]PHG62759.1 hypothetical protein COI59_19930 [Bacillus toyonensis]